MELEQFITTQLRSFDDIISHVETASFDRVELSGIVGAIKQWRGDGLPASIGSISWSVFEADPPAIENLRNTAIVAGWLPINVGLRHSEIEEFRVLKVVDGRKLFGGKKHSFRIYRCLPNGNFIFESKHSRTITAMWALQKLMEQRYPPV